MQPGKLQMAASGTLPARLWPHGQAGSLRHFFAPERCYEAQKWLCENPKSAIPACCAAGRQVRFQSTTSKQALKLFPSLIEINIWKYIQLFTNRS
jgi:hypothetical protein